MGRQKTYLTPMRGWWAVWYVLVLWGSLSFGIDMVPRSYTAHSNKVRFLDQRILRYRKIDGIAFSEISDLAYDRRTHRLLMIGDEGTIFAFDARFSDRIDALTPRYAAYLKTKKAKRLKRWLRDSEGLTIGKNAKVYVSFEGKPRIAQVCDDASCFGRIVKYIRLPKALRKIKRYRSKNKALESLAYHPVYGLITAPEWPLKGHHKKCHTIYDVSSKRTWCFQAEPEARSGISAMEVTDDGNVLVMERSFRGLLEPLVVTLKKVYLDQCDENRRCRSEVLVKMNTHRGWDIDNFEGLAKVGKNRYVMISDDNGNFFQKTLLVYFEVEP